MSGAHFSPGLGCIRCGKIHPLERYDRACDACAAEGVASNLTVTYPPRSPPERAAIPDDPRSLWRFAGCLPVSPEEAVSLGEGMTPLVPVDGVGPGRILVKDESRNPTGSFKDRLATVAVSWARAAGARVIGTSSSGNAGAAAAAYAARAGLPCVVLTFRGAGGAMVAQMRSYGAMVLETATKDDRWTALSRAVRDLGWFPTSPFFGPTAGSNPIGIEGYKTIAYEIAEQMGWRVPEWCVLPVCYGDALYGMWKGFEEMRAWGWTDRCPRLVAAEVSGSLSGALARELEMPPEIQRDGPSVAVSIDVARGTYQALHAIRRSGGTAIRVDDEALLHWRRELAASSGLFAELASAAAIAGISELTAAGTIGEGETVVAVLTATGLKDIGAAGGTGDAPLVTADLDSVLGALAEGYGFRG